MPVKTIILSKQQSSKATSSGQVSKNWLALLVIVLTIACTTVSSWAQSPKGRVSSSDESGSGQTKHIVAFNFGHQVLFGEWGTLYDDTITYGLSYTYEASPVFGVLLNLGLGNHSGLGNDSLTLRSIEPDLKVNFMYFDMLVLSGFAGFGLYPISQQVGNTSGSTLNFGMNLGFGLDLRVDEHFIFGPGVVFKSIFTKNDKSAISGAYPSGLTIGGEIMRLYIQMGYIF